MNEEPTVSSYDILADKPEETLRRRSPLAREETHELAKSFFVEVGSSTFFCFWELTENNPTLNARAFHSLRPFVFRDRMKTNWKGRATRGNT